jgi:hypothetical protein
VFLLKSMQEDVLATLKAFTGSADQMRKTTIIAIAAAAVLMPGGAYAKPLSAFSCNKC